MLMPAPIVPYAISVMNHARAWEAEFLFLRLRSLPRGCLLSELLSPGLEPLLGGGGSMSGTRRSYKGDLPNRG